MSAKTRAAAVFCARGFPAAAVAVATAALAPFGAVAVAGLVALVGAGAWAGTLRRASPLMAPPRAFIGS